MPTAALRVAEPQARRTRALARLRPPTARAVRREPLLARADTGAPLLDIVEEWGLQSFPASDAPANW